MSPLVLCYHAMSRNWKAGMSVAPDQLEAQVSALLARGYKGATFTESLLRPTPSRTFAITFDDAYRSVLELAEPVLRSLGVPATVFVPTGLAGSETPMAWPGIDQWVGGPHERELVPMNWEELNELAAGGWEIGSHTRSHPRLPGLADSELREELEGSRRDCEARTGRPCTSLAYPYGDFDQRVIAATSDAGYTAAGALAGRVRSPSALCWPRIGIYNVDRRVRFRLKTSPPVARLRASRLWRSRFLLRPTR